MAQIAYTEKRPKCQICHLPSFGAFVAVYKDEDKDDELACLCAECGFTRWTMNRHIKHLRLEVIFKLPEDKSPQPKVSLPEEDPFIPASYKATFILDGDPYTGPLDPCDGTLLFASPWAALERARQVSQALARSLNRSNFRSHWQINTAIHRIANGHVDEGVPQHAE